MTSLFLDTSVLLQEGLTSARMIELERCASSNKIELLVADVVAREFCTHLAAEARKAANAAAKAFDGIARRLYADGEAAKRAQAIAGESAHIESELAGAFNNTFDEWTRRCRARRLPFVAEAIHSVIDNYFEGRGAFSAPKQRKDFPDALILATVQTAIRDFPGLHCVVGDKHLRDACARCGASVYESLNAFFESPVGAELRTAMAKEAEELPAEVFFEAVSTWLRAATESIEEIYVEREQIDGLEDVADLIIGASINYPSAESIGAVVLDVVVRESDGKYILGCGFDAKARLDFATTYPHWFDIPQSRLKGIIEDGGDDDVVELQEWWRVGFEGKLVIEGNVADVVASGGRLINLDDFRVEIVVNRALLQRPENAIGRSTV